MYDAIAWHEKQKYDRLWQELPAYREDSPGELFAPHFFRTFGHLMRPNDRIVDFGCGPARSALQFLQRGLDVTLIDFSSACLDEQIAALLHLLPDRIRFIEACLWSLPSTLAHAEWIYCCDVLEHIPEDKVPEVLQALSARTLKGGYISIALQDDLIGKKFLGEPLHLTVKDKAWWREKILLHWQIVEEFDVLEDLYFNCSVIH